GCPCRAFVIMLAGSWLWVLRVFGFLFLVRFDDAAPPAIYTLSLHDALPILIAASVESSAMSLRFPENQRTAARGSTTGAIRASTEAPREASAQQSRAVTVVNCPVAIRARETSPAMLAPSRSVTPAKRIRSSAIRRYAIPERYIEIAVASPPASASRGSPEITSATRPRPRPLSEVRPVREAW